MRIYLIVTCFFCFLAGLAEGSNVLWMEVGNYRRELKEPTKIKLNFAKFPENSLGSFDVSTWVLIPNGDIVNPILKVEKEHVVASINTKYEGLYTVLASYSHWHDSQKVKNYSKLQFNRFGRKAKIKKKRSMPTVPLQINPVTQIHMHRKLHEGDSFVVQVLYNAEPLITDVLLKTEDGWSKTFRTDKRGIAKLYFIKDRFNSTHKIISEKYICIVEHKDNLPNSVLYKATYMIDVYPTPWNWQSKVVGYFTMLAVLIVVFIVTAIRRRGRK